MRCQHSRERLNYPDQTARFGSCCNNETGNPKDTYQFQRQPPKISLCDGEGWQREGAGSPVWLAGWMVDRPRCSGEILSRSVVDDIRTAAAAAAAIVERAGAAGWGRETSPAYSVRRIPDCDRGRGGNNKKEQRNESGPKFINGRQAVGRYARIQWSSQCASRGKWKRSLSEF